MKISFKGDYALKIILDLSVHYGEGLVQIRDIAKRQDIPGKFLEQIILLLKSAKYIRTQRGPAGGIALSVPPDKITLGKIIRLIDGPTAPVACASSSGYARCGFEPGCVFRDVWLEVRKKTNDIIDNITFEDMAKKETKIKKQKALHYSI